MVSPLSRLGGRLKNPENSVCFGQQSAVDNGESDAHPESGINIWLNDLSFPGGKSPPKIGTGTIHYQPSSV